VLGEPAIDIIGLPNRGRSGEPLIDTIVEAVSRSLSGLSRGKLKDSEGGPRSGSGEGSAGAEPSSALREGLAFS
ncbi:hypothetical protein MKK88_12605, partial [Methylobacterium sp. E-005]|uniref:hypothetical protein n=1 Tax=Methylobacterium sp. E-005 TaxID=2836549 RepID=UPI001FBA7ED0